MLEPGRLASLELQISALVRITQSVELVLTTQGGAAVVRLFDRRPIPDWNTAPCS